MRRHSALRQGNPRDASRSLSSAMPMPTASPCPSRWLVVCSSLCAAQWPKSSGRDEPCSNGSPPVAMCCRCSVGGPPDHLRHRRPDRDRASAAACASRKSKNAASRMSAALTASVTPPRQSRSDSVDRKLDVVDDGERRRERAEVVLLPEGVDAVLHAHRRIILRQHRGGHANQADAAMRGRGRKTRGVEHRPAADRDRYECRHSEAALIVSRMRVDVPASFLIGFAAGHDEHRRRQRDGVLCAGAIGA